MDSAAGVSVPSDGRMVVFNSIVDRKGVIKRVQPDGTGQAVLVEGSSAKVSPDGRWLHFRSQERVMRMPIDGGPRTAVGSGLEFVKDISPDSRRLLAFRDRPTNP